MERVASSFLGLISANPELIEVQGPGLPVAALASATPLFVDWGRRGARRHRNGVGLAYATTEVHASPFARSSRRYRLLVFSNDAATCSLIGSPVASSSQSH